MSNYDLENLCDDVKTILTTNLNTKIAEINSLKNDSTTLATIHSSSYIFQSMNGNQANMNPFVFYNIANIEDNAGVYSQSASKIDIAVAILVEDQGIDINISTRMLRYLRCLEEIFRENFDSITQGIKLTIKSLAPIEITLLNSTFNHRAVGVMITVDMS